jgi:hypothetical protein
MSDAVPPTFAGWYPDAGTGGTRYWEGSRWTGDTRPQRRPFAAAALHRKRGIWAVVIGALFVYSSRGAFSNADSDDPVRTFILTIAIGLAGVAAGIYWLRGQGPTTDAVKARLVVEQRVADEKRRVANEWALTANRGRPKQPPPPASSASSDSTAAAQIQAIASPETARSLQNLQNLLYTRAITDAEYAAAKVKLFGTQELDDSFAQIAKLAELHRAGVLGDVEFAAAKARVLRL